MLVVTGLCSQHPVDRQTVVMTTHLLLKRVVVYCSVGKYYIIIFSKN